MSRAVENGWQRRRRQRREAYLAAGAVEVEHDGWRILTLPDGGQIQQRIASDTDSPDYAPAPAGAPIAAFRG